MLDPGKPPPILLKGHRPAPWPRFIIHNSTFAFPLVVPNLPVNLQPSRSQSDITKITMRLQPMESAVKRPPATLGR